MISPLKHFKYPINNQNLFGAMRKYDYHTGIDLFADENSPVFAMLDCEVVQAGWFTGDFSYPPSPWWNDTEYVMCKTIINNNTLYFLYGEIISYVKVGDYLKEGDTIGHITRVLKKDKGLPTTMLHFEVYKSLPKEPLFWYHDQEKPDILMNPEPYVKMAIDCENSNSILPL